MRRARRRCCARWRGCSSRRPAACGSTAATCGSSRAGLSLLAAFIYNPLVTLALCIGICILAIRFTSGRQLVMNWSRRIDRLVPLCLVAVVLVNWIYVLSRH